jgi:hypothetical protein
MDGFFVNSVSPTRDAPWGFLAHWCPSQTEFTTCKSLCWPMRWVRAHQRIKREKIHRQWKLLPESVGTHTQPSSHTFTLFLAWCYICSIWNRRWPAQQPESRPLLEILDHSMRSVRTPELRQLRVWMRKRKRKNCQAVKATPHINKGKGATLVPSTVKLLHRKWDACWKCFCSWLQSKCLTEGSTAFATLHCEHQ